MGHGMQENGFGKGCFHCMQEKSRCFLLVSHLWVMVVCLGYEVLMALQVAAWSMGHIWYRSLRSPH